jgi:hypothetical protein
VNGVYRWYHPADAHTTEEITDQFGALVARSGHRLPKAN